MDGTKTKQYGKSAVFLKVRIYVDSGDVVEVTNCETDDESEGVAESGNHQLRCHFQRDEEMVTHASGSLVHQVQEDPLRITIRQRVRAPGSTSAINYQRTHRYTGQHF